jgi:hypothetical protein
VDTRDGGSSLIALLVSLAIMAVLAVIIFSSLGGSPLPNSLPRIVTGTATATTSPGAAINAAVEAADKQVCLADTASLRAAEEESQVIVGHYSTVAGLVTSGLLAAPSALHDVPASTLTAGSYQVWTVGAAGSVTKCGPGGAPVTDGANGAF